MKQLILAIALLLLSPTIYSNYLVLGVGNRTCATYVDKYNYKDSGKTIDYATFEFFSSWVTGFITGYNLKYNTNLGKKTETSELDLWIYSYCLENPLDKVSTAADALTIELETD